MHVMYNNWDAHGSRKTNMDIGIGIDIDLDIKQV